MLYQRPENWVLSSPLVKLLISVQITRCWRNFERRRKSDDYVVVVRNHSDLIRIGVGSIFLFCYTETRKLSFKFSSCKDVYNPLNNSLRKLKENPTKFLACRGKMKEKKWSAKWSANGVQPEILKCCTDTRNQNFYLATCKGVY